MLLIIIIIIFFPESAWRVGPSIMLVICWIFYLADFPIFMTVTQAGAVYLPESSALALCSWKGIGVCRADMSTRPPRPFCLCVQTHWCSAGWSRRQRCRGKTHFMKELTVQKIHEKYYISSNTQPQWRLEDMLLNDAMRSVIVVALVNL